MEELKINIDCDPQLCKLISLVLNEVRKEYDISKHIFENILNKQGIFIQLSEFIYIQILNSPDTISEIKMNSERCGHVMEIFENGYKRHCLEHKYIHYNIIEHKFKEFTDNEIDEYIEQETMYKNIIDKELKIVNKLYYLFINYMLSCSEKIVMKINSVNNISEFMKSSKYHFREKNAYKGTENCIYVYKFLPELCESSDYNF